MGENSSIFGHFQGHQVMYCVQNVLIKYPDRPDSEHKIL